MEKSMPKNKKSSASPEILNDIIEGLEQAIESKRDELECLRRIESLELEVKNKRAELECMIRMSLEQGNNLSEDTRLVNKSKELDEMVSGLHDLKADFAVCYGDTLDHAHQQEAAIIDIAKRFLST